MASGAKWVLSNRIATIVAAIIIALGLIGIVDTATNWGKAYGNVSIGGLSVSGMTSEEIQSALAREFGQPMSQTQVEIYASEEDADPNGEHLTDNERIALAEQISVEDAIESVTSWKTSALELSAAIPYKELADKAIELGRSDGGLPGRLGLLLFNKDIPLEVNFDEAAVEQLASEIDMTIGDPRIDASVVIDTGTAVAVQGHDGQMVDRPWFKSKLTDSLLSKQSTSSFVANASYAPSRITFEEAQSMSDAVNRAIETGASFSYGGSTWNATAYELGSWIDVVTNDNGDGSYNLKASINADRAVPEVMSGSGAIVKADDITVSFEKSGDNILVHTSGPGTVPEVTSAVASLDEGMFGADGTAWRATAGGNPIAIEIKSSNAPETLSVDQAVQLGIVTVIGEYTTAFTNYEGTENRNHNIKLAADMLNNSIAKAKGGSWSFNDLTGDSNENPAFWSAGSIVDGELVDSVGGGICQVATTVFNAVYEAGLKVDKRWNHTLYISSYPTGRDAAVNYPDLDLQWTNDLDSDILVSLSYTDTSITARLYGIYTGYWIKSEEGEWVEGAKYTTQFEVDSSLGASYYKKTSGADGSQISVTRTVYDENDHVVRNDVFTSNYQPKNEIYVVGPDVDQSKLARDTSA